MKAAKEERKARKKNDDVSRAFKEADAGPDPEEQAHVQVGRGAGRGNEGGWNEGEVTAMVQALLRCALVGVLLPGLPGAIRRL